MIRTSLLPQAYTHEKVMNGIRYWWQSRMVKNGIIPALPILTDIPALAQSIRRTWGHQ